MTAEISKSSTPTTSVTAQGVILSPGDMEADLPVCRICFADASSSSEQLLTPCDCRGSIRFVHRRCLERWLGSTAGGGGACELCRRQYDTVRTPKSCWQWIRHHEPRFNRPQMIADLVLLLFGTPLCLGCAWLCGKYYKKAAEFILTILAIFCLLLYWYVKFLWNAAVRFFDHCAMCRKWRARNFNVRIVDRQPPLDGE